MFLDIVIFQINMAAKDYFYRYLQIFINLIY